MSVPAPFHNVCKKEIEMRLTSLSIEEGNRMPAVYSYPGGNRSPELSWQDPPEGTRSFAVTCFDPDAPTGSGWWHWCVVNLPETVRSLPEGVSPADIEALGAITLRNDYGEAEYGGAAPPAGDGMHRYVFTVWALPVEKLDLTEKNNCPTAGFVLHAQALATAKLTATYVTE